MKMMRTGFILTLGLTAAIVVGYGYANRPGASLSFAPQASAAERSILYYRDPTGAPAWSATPKNDGQGRAYLPVYDDAEPSFDLPKPPALAPLAPLKSVQSGERKVLFYRNPMGLPDTSPVPKKDSMGMDYIAVYEGDEQPGGTIKVSLDRVQRSGVRTEPAQARAIVRALRAVGTVAIDERRATIVTMRSDGYVEDLFVNTTGQHVQAGEPLFRVYSPDIQQALSDLLVAKGWAQRGPAEASGSGRSVDGAMQRLRNLGLSDNRIREIRDSGTNPRVIDWLAPAGGTVIAKKIVNGQKVIAGDELYRIVDLTNLWVIADVAEGDLADIKPGMRATVTFRAYRSEPVEGVVTFIYPDVRPETRTVRVRIEVANPDERLKPDMYADVALQVGTDRATVTAVPTSAIIDTGTKQIVLVAKGEGRFEPRLVKLGRRGDGYVEIVEGLRQGEEIVTTATFLIDAESNLQSALKTFTEQEQPK